MGRAHNSHLIKGEHPTEKARHSDRPANIYWCGLEDSFLARSTTNPDLRNVCPKCSQAYWADRLEREPNGLALGKRLTDAECKALGRQYGYAHVYPIEASPSNGLGALGFIALNAGFGQPWCLIQWKGATLGDVGEGRDPKPAMGYEVSGDDSRAASLAYRSKAQALWAAGQLASAGKMKLQTWGEVLEEGRAWAAEVRVREERRAKKQATEAEQLAADTAHITQAFTELLASEHVSNFQREGLVLAARRMGLTVAGL